jgi:hypothetical protein
MKISSNCSRDFSSVWIFIFFKKKEMSESRDEVNRGQGAESRDEVKRGQGVSLHVKGLPERIM